MIGTTIDQYRIVARIGGGGMGEVYRAIDLELQRDVAIKCVRPELADLDEVTKRFRNEARTLARLSHPNIATVFRFFTDNERLFLVMEYIQGTPFGDRMRQQGVPQWQEAVSMVRNALHGLGYAHEQGIVHRDIKPGNLMIDQRGTVKVLDFGIAHLIGGTRLTRAGSVVGTPAYMAPEQILGKSVDPRTDLYSLGIVLYELLSGQLPYQGDSEFELMRSHLEKAPPPLRDLTNSKIPVALQNTVETALGKEKSDRFQTAAEFDEALNEAVEDRTSVRVSKTTILPPPPPPTAPSPAPTLPAAQPMSELIRPVATEIRKRMRPSQIGAGAAVALLVIAAGWWLTGSSGTDSQNNPAPLALDPGLQPNPQNGFPPTGLMSDGTLAADQIGQGSPVSQSSFGDAVVSAADVGPGSGSSVAAPGNPNGIAAGHNPMAAASQPPVQTQRNVPPPRVEPRREPAPQPAPQPAQRPVETRPAVGASGASVSAVKVSYHERQGTGRWSRDAGYNGAFTLRFPAGRSQGLAIEEVIVVRQEGRVVKNIPVSTETRVPGQFKSKNRVPGLKELAVGLYDVELQFHAEGRQIGSYKWRLEVVN